MNECLKVVIAHDTDTDSYVSAIALEPYCLTYIPNTIVKPVIGKLFVFVDKYAARYFAQGLCSINTKIFRCECGDLVKLYTRAMDMANVERFWEEPHTRSYAIAPALGGTYVTTWLKMLEEIR